MNKALAILVCIICGISLILSPEKSLIANSADHTTVNFHTPAFASGYYLPLHITEQVHLTPDMGVIIVTGTTTIEKGARLSIAPGTTIAMNEHASLIVNGSIDAIGEHAKPIRFISNEAREENRTWSGIMFTQGSIGTIANAIFHHASPSVSCSEKTTVTITDTSFAFGNLEVFGPCI